MGKLRLCEVKNGEIIFGASWWQNLRVQILRCQTWSRWFTSFKGTIFPLFIVFGWLTRSSYVKSRSFILYGFLYILIFHLTWFLVHPDHFLVQIKNFTFCIGSNELFYVVQCKCNAFLVNSEVSNFTNLSQFQLNLVEQI